MSQQELKLVEVIALRRSGQIKQSEAARRLGMTERQVRRPNLDHNSNSGYRPTPG